jgi:dihydroorotate dehydrogenase (NAD+) catalytic subunit
MASANASTLFGKNTAAVSLSSANANKPIGQHATAAFNDLISKQHKRYLNPISERCNKDFTVVDTGMRLDLKVNVAGLEMRNPIMLSAGILGMTGKSLRAVWEAGAGAVVTKSIGLKPREGYPGPVVVDVGCGLINAMGLPNPGARAFLEELSAARLGGPITIVGSVYGSTPTEFAQAAEILCSGGVDAIELNVSCPHVREVDEVGHDHRLVEDVVRVVKQRVKVPVFLKLTPNVASIVDLARAAERGGADGVVAVNTLRAMAIDIETCYPVLGNKVGGLSGPALKPIAVSCVYEVSRAIRAPIIGCGGVMGWKDAVELMLAGASAVQVGSAVAYRGLEVFSEITRGLERYLKRKGYRSVHEIVGLSHKA